MTTPPPISKFTLWFFRWIVRVYFWLHFRAVRVSRPEIFAQQTGPLIVFGNHSSWWDPMVAFLLAADLMGQRAQYAPMDATSLKRHGILKRIGVFPIEMHSARGAAQFIRTGLSVLAAGGVLWITPQGRFADTRELPLAFKPGLAALAARMPGGCTVLPLAVEFTFWNERLPESLLHFGEPIVVNGESAEMLQPRLEAALLQAMDELRALAITRDPSAFTTLNRGFDRQAGLRSPLHPENGRR